MYVSGQPTRDPDVMIFHLCRAFQCLPTELEMQDADLMERLFLIHEMVEGHYSKKIEEASHGRK